jgi:hypothetical protein
MTEVYLLYSTAETNDTSLEAVVTDLAIAEKWARRWGNHYETKELNNLREIAWAIKDDQHQLEGATTK